MLLVLFVTALSAAPAPSADSVRIAAKPGSARIDTTLSSLPTPTITAPRQPAPEVLLPIRPVTAIARMPAPSGVPEQVIATAESAAPRAEAVRQAGATVEVSEAPSTPKDVVATPASAPAATTATTTTTTTTTTSTAVPAAPEPTDVATLASSADAMAKPLAAAPVALPASPATPAEPKAEEPTESASAPAAAVSIQPPALAPADAVATAAAPSRSVVTTTRVDPRTVVSVRSSESIEPLYAVPIPTNVRLTRPTVADSIVVYKRERTLILYNRGVPVRSYFVALGSKPVGDKERAGDQKTPEGLFRITAHNPASKFHLGLRLSYPLESHRTRAAALGVDPGGDIMIHGLPKEFSEAGKDHRQNDWTNGCVALSNQEIEEIWHAVPDGTPVQIKP
jgi:hypothetical protein